MPVTFIQVGMTWINVELVISVELVPDPRDPAKLIAARLQYTTGKYQDFKAASDIQELSDWLRAHKAP